jgi:hypothetical protein
VPPVDAAGALAELTEISAQIEAAVIVDDKGDVLAASRGGGAALAEAGRSLLEHAARVGGGKEPTQIDASTAEGSVFVVHEGGRTIVATTPPESTVGLVFYDLKTCLRSIESSKKKRARGKKGGSDDAA